MIAFADSSAIVKLYADELGFGDVRAIDELVISALTRVEIPSAFWHKCRMGELAESTAAGLIATFEDDYFGTESAPPRFAAVDIGPSVLDGAARLLRVHGLRAYDAVQLATAIVVADAVSGCRTIVTYDKDLYRAAAAEGLDVVPAELLS